MTRETTMADFVTNTILPYGANLNTTPGYDAGLVGSPAINFSTLTPAGQRASSRDAMIFFQYRIVPSFYIVLCLVGIVGNGVVIKVLWSIMARATLKSVTDILVINLAVADFIFVGSLPFWATELFLKKRWIFGTVGCKLMSFITLLNLYGSVFFLVAMGIDRYLAVVYAVRARNYRTPRNAAIACAVIWSFASLIGMEALLFRVITETKLRNGLVIEKCIWELPDEEGWLTTYYVLRVLFGFVLPFLVIMFCYILIIIKLHRRARSSRLTGSNITNKQQKITRAILAVISLFVACWLPNHIVTVMHAAIKSDETKKKLNLLTANLVSVCLAYANSSINPILYAFMKEEIRQEGTELIIRFFTCCKQTPNDFTRGPAINKNRRGLPRFSFWRSTRHTMLVVVPRETQSEIKADENEKNHVEKNDTSQGSPSGSPPEYAKREDVYKSKDSLMYPTTPGTTSAKSNASPEETPLTNECQRVNLVVSTNEEGLYEEAV